MIQGSLIVRRRDRDEERGLHMIGRSFPILIMHGSGSFGGSPVIGPAGMKNADEAAGKKALPIVADRSPSAARLVPLSQADKVNFYIFQNPAVPSHHDVYRCLAAVSNSDQQQRMGMESCVG